MQLNDIKVPGLPGKWLLGQFAQTFGIRAAAVRKIRERAFRQFQTQNEGTAGVKIVATIAERLRSTGLQIQIGKRADEGRLTSEQKKSLFLLRDFLSSCNAADVSSAERLIRDIEAHGLARVSGVDIVGTMNSLAALLRGDQVVALEFVERRLYHRLGTLAERFLASAAWIFRFNALDESLHAEVSHNSDLNAETGGLILGKGEGIVGHVATTLRPYICRAVSKDPHYRHFDLATRSEIAIPVFRPNSKDLLAVVNLESKRDAWFTHADAIQLQSLVTDLVPDVMVQSALRSADPLLGAWHHRRDGWSIDQPLSRFCELVSRTLREKSGVKAAAIIWEYDDEKASFWVRGNSGYDHEYATAHGLPPKSFLGSVFRDRNAVRLTLGEAKDAAFRRSLKAEALGVEWLAACPISTPHPSRPPWGVLAIYGFRASESIHLELLVQLAASIGRLAPYWETIRQNTAKAYAISKMSRVPDRGNARNEAARDVLVELLAADGVSLFATQQRHRLTCLATTGLENAMGPLYNFREAIYDQDVDTGATVLLSKSPGSILRRIDATDEDEPIRAFGMPSKIRFSNRFRETAAWSPMEKRRFIGLGVLREDKSVVVARGVRRAGRRPFREADGRMLVEVLTELADTVQSSLTSARDSNNCTRLLCADSCQLDTKVAAILQSALLTSKHSRPERVQLFSLRRGKRDEWEESPLCSHGAIGDLEPEQSRFSAMPRARLEALFGPQLSGLTPLTVDTGERQRPAIFVPFVVPYLDAGNLYLIRVDYPASSKLASGDVEAWVRVAQFLTVAVGLSALQRDVHPWRLFRSTESMSAYTASMRTANCPTIEKIWSEDKSHGLAVALGPEWLGYASRNHTIRWWLEKLARFLQETPPSTCSPLFCTDEHRRWKVSGGARAFQAFLGAQDGNARGAAPSSSRIAQ
jgi:hypothetical protein